MSERAASMDISSAVAFLWPFSFVHTTTLWGANDVFVLLLLTHREGMMAERIR